MASKMTSFIGKIDGQVITGNLLSTADIEKIKSYHGKVDTNEGKIAALETKVASINKYQRSLATKDYYTDDTHLAEMDTNVVYMVAFSGEGTFVAPADSGTQFWPGGQAPSYFQLVRKDADGTKQKLGMEKYSPDLDDVLSKITDNEFRGYMMRVVEADDAEDTDSVAYMTKFKEITAASNPTKQLFSGHLALDKDNVKLYAHTGTVDKEGNRQASLGVYNSSGSAAGEVVLKTNADGSQVTFEIPQPSSAAGDKEAATVKYVKDTIGDLQHVKMKYQASAPDEGSIQDNELYFFDATDLL